MKKLLLIACLCLPIIASAQKLNKPKVDPITGDTSLTTTKEKLYLQGNYLTGKAEAVEFWLSKLSKYKSTALFLYPQTLNMDRTIMITKDQKVFLKLSDNSTITVTSMTNDIGDFKAFYAGDYLITKGAAIAAYLISDADLEKLKTTPLTFLRIETSSGNFDCEIKPKQAETLKKAVNLFTASK